MTALNRADIVAEAREWIGTPFVHQQSMKGVGTDCVGLVRGVWRALIGDEPESPPAYPSRVDLLREPLLGAYMRRHMTEAETLGLGDVAVLRLKKGAHAHHAAIYAGDNMFIHAWGGASGHPVLIGPLRQVWEIESTFAYPGVK